MRFFYQKMIAFIIVILVIILTMGTTLIRFSREQVYLRQQDELSQMAEYLVGQDITFDYLKQIQPILDSANMKVYYYNEDNERQYPAFLDDKQQEMPLSSSEKQQLKSGQRLSLRPYDMGFQKDKLDSMSIFIPLERPNNQQYAGYLVLGAPAYMTNEALDELNRSVFRAILISLAVAGFLAWLLAYYQNRSIKRLGDATKEIANGNYDVQLRLKTGDEFDDLSQNFNQMAEALKVSQKEINRQETLRHQLMMDVAHEMRTPLTTMLGMLKGMKDHVFPQEKWDRSITLVYKETERLKRLVNESLDYEKIRANEIKLAKAVFPVQDVVNDIAMQLQQEADKKHTTITVSCPEQATVYADPDRFRQIVVNIVKNAVQFTDKGDIQLTVEETADDTAIRVKDTGMGMTAEQIENIWQRFYKVDTSRKAMAYGESGLGLSIVKQLMNRHHGEVTVNSELGVGSEFILTFPKQEALEEDKGAKTED
ncbi:ATP-binding protein [Aerococcus suis]